MARWMPPTCGTMPDQRIHSTHSVSQALAADARPGIGHADDAVRPAVEPHRELRGLFHGRVKLGGQFLRAVGQQVAIHQIDVAGAVHRDLVAPAGHGRIAVGRIDAAAAEHERHRPARLLIALVSPQRRKGRFGEEIDQRHVAVERAGDALDVRALPRAFEHRKQPVLFRRPRGNRRFRLRPKAVFGDQVQDIDQRLAEPDRQRGVGVDGLLPGENAMQQRGVVLGEQPGRLGGIG